MLYDTYEVIVCDDRDIDSPFPESSSGQFWTELQAREALAEMLSDARGHILLWRIEKNGITIDSWKL